MKPKKSLGQNFLQDQSIVDRILEDARLQPSDWVIEIGPGEGVLTEALAEKAEKVVAIEFDRDLIPFLLKKFPISRNVSIIEGDILRLDIIEHFKKAGWKGESFKVVANIPYYITAPIIQKLLRLHPQPQEIVLMVQKEVAERITAESGAMSILSVSVQYYADAKMMFTVPRTAFHPIPKVESAIVRIFPKHEFDPEKDKALFHLVHIGFSSRRKTLVNNLASGLRLPKNEVINILKSVGLDENIRAQNLGVEDWVRLERDFKEYILPPGAHKE